MAQPASRYSKPKTRKKKEYKAAKAKADKKNQCNKDGDKIVVKQSDYTGVTQNLPARANYVDAPYIPDRHEVASLL